MIRQRLKAVSMRIGIVRKEIKMKFCRLFLMFVFLFSAQILFAQKQLTKEIDNYLKPLVEKNQFSGVILATKNGKNIYEKAFGFANAELKVANQINTRFGIASVTKAMTRIIALRLLTEQRVALQDKLTKFVPDFPNGDQITVEMLIRHRSGIPHRVTKPEEEAVPYSPADIVEKAKLAKIVFTPGTQRLYSSAGYSVLTRVLEIASGKTFPQLLQQYIFGLVPLTDFSDFNGERLLERRAQEYLLESNGIVHSPLKDYSFLVGAGSVFGTARDVYQFGNALLDGKFGESARLSLQDEEGVFNDNGNANGYRCYFDINRQKGYGFVLITNLESGANDLIVRDIPQILEGKNISAPVVPGPAVISDFKEDLSQYAGTYWQDAASFEITSSRNTLFAGRFKLYPIGKDKFYNFAGYVVVTFARDENDRIKSMVWDSPAETPTWIRK